VYASEAAKKAKAGATAPDFPTTHHAAKRAIRECAQIRFQKLWDERANKHDHLFAKVGPAIDRFGLKRDTRRMWAKVHSGWGPWKWSGFKQGFNKNPHCPSCAAAGFLTPETSKHLFSCSHDPKRVAARENLWKNLKSGGFKQSTISLLKNQASSNRSVFEDWCVGAAELGEKKPLGPDAKIDALTTYLREAHTWYSW